MLTRSLLVRIAGPTLFVGLLSLGSCLVAALCLHHRQSAAMQQLHESLASRRAAADLLGALAALAALDDDRGAEAEALDARIAMLLDRAERSADTPEESRLAASLRDRFGDYLRRRRAGGPSGDDHATRSLLEAEVLPIARRLERLHAADAARSEAELGRTVAWMAAAQLGVGVVGTMAALLSGYAAARGLGRAVLRAEELAEVGQIAAGLAHELRNPLTSIKMLVQIDRERAEARGLPSDDLYAIEQEILRMEGRLNAFMDFARPTRPERRELDLATVVEQTLALVRGRAGKQRVALRFDRPAEPVLADADGEQLRQLLVNLALNALDVMPRGGVLEIRLEAPPDGPAELLVMDTGPGIDPRHLARLYEPFFTSKETGLGLGLAVSQRIAGDHGGILRARNRPEGGACFVLQLPAIVGHLSGASP